jgi:hypothetical protein
MNKIRFGFFLTVAAFALAAGKVHAQTSLQRLTFSLIGEFQTNTFTTNTDNAAEPLTNEEARLHAVLITTVNVIKALAVDVEGTNWRKFSGGSLFREINLTNGAEGMLLRQGTNEADVSSYFQGSFSNNFTAGLSNAFPGYTNNISGQTNDIFGPTNLSLPQIQIYHGSVNMPNATTTNTNYMKVDGLYFISLNTTNLKFNLVGVGEGFATNLTGSIDGVTYGRTNIDSEYIGTAGTFYLNVETNIFDVGGTNPTPLFFTGPMHGSVNVGQPRFDATVTPP